MLLQAMAHADQHLQESPHWAAMQVVKRQLSAMQRWTADMRTPTREEREKINIGLIAAREFDDAEEIARLCHKLNHFFQVWPLAKGE